jgi:metal-responsive CopG/Arc/MetJ family transcriptional regulator
VKKKRISIILSENIMREIREKMLKDGYSLREKSKWVSEAIEDLLKLEEYHFLVKTAELFDDFNKTETFYIATELDGKLKMALIEVRKKYPSIEGVKSLIIRASIIRRIVINGERT